MRLWLLWSLSLICLASGAAGANGHAAPTHRDAHPEPASESRSNWSRSHDPAVITGIPIVTFKWHHVEAPYLVVLWVLVAFLAKLGM